MIRPVRHEKTGVFQIRKVVPADLRSIVGKRELTRSLGTKDVKEAKRLARPVIDEFERIVEAARMGEALPVGSPVTEKPPSRSSRAHGSSGAPVLAEELLTTWARETNPAPATLKKFRNNFAQLTLATGISDLRHITADHVIMFKEKRLGAGRSHGTVADDIGNCGTVFNWATENNKLSGNPFAKKAPRGARRPAKPREGYTDAETKQILLAARACTGWMRWLPWVLAFTGCRLNEVAERQRSDVREVAGVWILDVRHNVSRRLKTDESQRMVPLHPALVAEGFLAYVEGLPGGDKDSLFPDLAIASDGTRTTTAQSQHSRWLKKSVGIVRPGLAPAHSWRHRMVDELRLVEALPEIADAITGHHNPRNAGANYGKGYRGLPAKTLDTLSRIRSPLDDAPAPLPAAPAPVEDRPLAYAPELEAALKAWFQHEIDRAYHLTVSGEFADAIIPEDADPIEHHEQNLHYVGVHATTRLDELARAGKAQDFSAGQAVVLRLLEERGHPPPPSASDLGFLAASRRALALLCAIEEARCRWSDGDLEYRPDLNDPSLK